MKKLPFILTLLVLVSCFKEPKKENNDSHVYNTIDIEKTQNKVTIIDTATVSEDINSINKNEKLTTSLVELENLLNINDLEFSNWCKRKGYKLNTNEKKHNEYVKSKNDYIIKDYKKPNEKSSFSIYTFNEKLFYQIKEECNNNGYNYLNTIESDNDTVDFYSNNIYKIMFFKYSIGNYSITISTI